ncbi:MAG TPA: hypothetical protein VNT22_06360 [Baekduia sp.]|nr:hypothetical protein [Baekduia sp.]
MIHDGRLSVIVSGMVCATPRQGGATWAALQYVTGLRELGHDVMFVEQLSDEAVHPRACSYFEDAVAAFGLQDRAGLITASGAAIGGVSRAAIERFAAGADLLFNLSGTLTDEALLERIALRVYVDLDPGFTQLWNEVDGVEMGFDRHHRFVTVGLAMTDGDAPTLGGGRSWTTTRQPVDLKRWPVAVQEVRPLLTSVGHWRGYGSITHEGTVYGQRAHSMRPLLSIASRADIPIEFALGIDPAETADIDALRRHGWLLADPDRVAGTPAAYSDYVRSSWAELGIAKSGYVQSKSGWFSDRSACYLASGRPVIAQETGFSDHLPTGTGLFSFCTVDQALEAIDAVRADYRRHSLAARQIAEDLFDSGPVLSGLIEAL